MGRGHTHLADHVPDFDSTVVAKLESAGAVLLGKLNLTEGAMGGYNPKFQIPVNPWNAERFAGASSSGSGAATAGGAVLRFSWQRYRWLDSFPGRTLWDGRSQTHMGAGQSLPACWLWLNRSTMLDH